MVNVLVDDKQAPTSDHLEDVTVYCDGAPNWADYPKCDDMYPSYPGELRDSKGIIHDTMEAAANLMYTWAQVIIMIPRPVIRTVDGHHLL